MAQRSTIQILGATGVPALCGHIKNLKSIVFQIGHAFQETMSEIEEAINDFPVASSITVSAEGWQEVTPTNSMGDYDYYYDISNSEIDNSDLPIVTVSPADIATTAECGLCPTCESLNGAIRLYAKTQPEDDIRVSCWVIKGQTASEKTDAMEEIEDWDVMGSVAGGATYTTVPEVNP